jgi:peroxiredoxin/uncharacterized membrane protein YphA (DoxX/SURF4 family)
MRTLAERLTIGLATGAAEGGVEMATTALVARVLLAAVLAVAGVAKLRDRASTRAALRGFGLPGGLVPAGALVLPVAELLVAAGLLAPPTAFAATIVAGALLVMFTLAVAMAIARGRTVRCACFGASGAAPVGARTLVRNAALLGVAAVALAGGSAQDPVRLSSGLDPAGRVALGAGIVVLALVVAGGWLIRELLRAHGRLLLRLDALEAGGAPPRPPEAPSGGLPVGALAPDFTLPDTDGEQVELDSILERGRPVLLVFSDTRCGACATLLPRVGAWQREHADKLTVVLLAAGEPTDVRAEREEHGLSWALVQPRGELALGVIADVYRAAATPAAVLVDPQGRVASAVASGPAAVEALAREALGDSGPLVPGTVAPELALNGTSGQPVGLAPDAERTLVLFWDPACRACDEALGEVRAWDAGAEGAPPLLVVSRGSAEANRGLGLAAPVGIDADDRLTHNFGIRGTPSAVLVDRGRVAAPVAEGLSAIRVLVALASRDVEGAQR